MTTFASVSDPAVYRQLLRVTFADLCACLWRLQRIVAEAEAAPPVADLVARRVGHLRAFVEIMGGGSGALSPEIDMACSTALVEIDRHVQAGELTTACQLAVRLLETIARGVPWLALG